MLITFEYRGIRVFNTKLSNNLNPNGFFYTTGLTTISDGNSVFAYDWYTNSIEKIVLASPHCTDKTRRMIYRRVVRRAQFYRGRKP